MPRKGNCGIFSTSAGGHASAENILPRYNSWLEDWKWKINFKTNPEFSAFTASEQAPKSSRNWWENGRKQCWEIWISSSSMPLFQPKENLTSKASLILPIMNGSNPTRSNIFSENLIFCLTGSRLIIICLKPSCLVIGFHGIYKFWRMPCLHRRLHAKAWALPWSTWFLPGGGSTNFWLISSWNYHWCFSLLSFWGV